MLKAEGYSAEVALSLVIAGTRLPVQQVCPDALYLSEFNVPFPPGDALIVIGVDGEEKQMDVVLPNGITSTRVNYF
jgi:hypothetical protein